MKGLFIVLCIAIAYKSWDHFTANKSLDPLYDKPYVAVYGRDSCGFTQNTLKVLSSKGIAYVYLKVDDRDVADQLHPRMEQAGISTRSYLLPVVDVNGKIFVRPETGDIINQRQQQ